MGAASSPTYSSQTPRTVHIAALQCHPATLDVWLPHGCGLEIGNPLEWVLRDRLTGEVLQRRETVSQVDLW